MFEGSIKMMDDISLFYSRLRFLTSLLLLLEFEWSQRAGTILQYICYIIELYGVWRWIFWRYYEGEISDPFALLDAALFREQILCICYTPCLAILDKEREPKKKRKLTKNEKQQKMREVISDIMRLRKLIENKGK